MCLSENSFYFGSYFQNSVSSHSKHISRFSILDASDWLNFKIRLKKKKKVSQIVTTVNKKRRKKRNGKFPRFLKIDCALERYAEYVVSLIDQLLPNASH